MGMTRSFKFFSQRIARGVVVGLVAGLLAGCSGFDVLNLLAPRGDFSVAADIAYGSDARQKLDVVSPKNRIAGIKYPVVIFLYGGGWTSHSRREYRFAGEALASKGLVAVVADYRLFPEVKFPAPNTDAALALRWTRDHIAEYHGDPDAIFVMGHSAGAHIGALLSLDPSYARAVGVPDGTIKGFIGLAGPYAMVPSQVASVRDIFAGLPDENVARPVRFVSTAAPPALLLYGLDDKTVARANAATLSDLLRGAGRDVTLREYPDVGHAGLVIALVSPFPGRAPVLEDAAGFVARIARSRP